MNGSRTQKTLPGTILSHRCTNRSESGGCSCCPTPLANNLKVSSAGARAVSRMSTSSSSMLKQLLLAASAMVNRTSGSDAQNFHRPNALSRPWTSVPFSSIHLSMRHMLQQTPPGFLVLAIALLQVFEYAVEVRMSVQPLPCRILGEPRIVFVSQVDRA